MVRLGAVRVPDCVLGMRDIGACRNVLEPSHGFAVELDTCDVAGVEN